MAAATTHANGPAARELASLDRPPPAPSGGIRPPPVPRGPPDPAPVVRRSTGNDATRRTIGGAAGAIPGPPTLGGTIRAFPGSTGTAETPRTMGGTVSPGPTSTETRTGRRTSGGNASPISGSTGMAATGAPPLPASTGTTTMRGTMGGTRRPARRGTTAAIRRQLPKIDTTWWVDLRADAPSPEYADFVHHLFREVDDVERVVFEVVDPGLVEPGTTRVNRRSRVAPDLWGGGEDPELLDEEHAARTAEADLAACLAAWEHAAWEAPVDAESSAMPCGTRGDEPVPPPHGGADDPVDDSGVSAGPINLLGGAPPPQTHVGLTPAELRLILSDFTKDLTKLVAGVAAIAAGYGLSEAEIGVILSDFGEVVTKAGAEVAGFAAAYGLTLSQVELRRILTDFTKSLTRAAVEFAKRAAEEARQAIAHATREEANAATETRERAAAEARVREDAAARYARTKARSAIAEVWRDEDRVAPDPYEVASARLSQERQGDIAPGWRTVPSIETPRVKDRVAPDPASAKPATQGGAASVRTTTPSIEAPHLEDRIAPDPLRIASASPRAVVCRLWTTVPQTSIDWTDCRAHATKTCTDERDDESIGSLARDDYALSEQSSPGPVDDASLSSEIYAHSENSPPGLLDDATFSSNSTTSEHYSRGPINDATSSDDDDDGDDADRDGRCWSDSDGAEDSSVGYNDEWSSSDDSDSGGWHDDDDSIDSYSSN